MKTRYQRQDVAVPDPSAPIRSGHAKPAQLIVLTVIVAAEALFVTGATLWFLYEFLTVTPQSYITAIAIIVLVALAAAWTVGTFVGLLRLRAWARASTVTIQILMIAVAVGSFQGRGARPDVGWALLAPAVVASVLVLTPSVVRATARGGRNAQTRQ